MPMYRVCATVTGSKYLGEFEADSEDEAVEKALNSEAACVSLCHQCSGECEDPECRDANAEEIKPSKAAKKARRKTTG